MKSSTLRKICTAGLGIALGTIIIANVMGSSNPHAFAKPDDTQKATSEPFRVIVPESLKQRNREIADDELVVTGTIKTIEKEDDEISLTPQTLPDEYYDHVDYSSFWAFESFDQEWSDGSDSYNFLHSKDIYTDNNGLMRKPVPDGDLKLEGEYEDDYIVALGSHYKTPHKCGERFLIITTTGEFTIITGDEQDDHDTDKHNMFIWGEKEGEARLLEFIVNEKQLNREIRSKGTVTAAPVEAFQGEIISMLRIG